MDISNSHKGRELTTFPLTFDFLSSHYERFSTLMDVSGSAFLTMCLLAVEGFQETYYKET